MNIPLKIRQFFCPHHSRFSKAWIEHDGNGRPLVRALGRCEDCGKGVPSEIPNERIAKMLYEAEERT